MRDRYASVHLDVEPSQATHRAALEIVEDPFQILLVGDFSGRGSRGGHAGAAEPPAPIPVDRDDFNAVLAQLAPRVRLALESDGPPLEITFRDIDDFHPDGLYERAPLFARLRELRRRVLDPRQISAVAVELGHGPPAPAAVPPGATPPASGGALLDLILDEAAPPTQGASAEAVLESPAGLSNVIRALVRPHLAPRPDPRQAELLQSIDTAIAEGMRRVLHHPSFQALESIWRGLYLLVRRVETDRLLQLRIVDISDDQLERALATDAWKPGEPALIVVLRSFAGGEADFAVLRELGRLGRRLRAPCLVAGEPELIGVPDAAGLGDPARWSQPPSDWGDLRADPAALFLGVALPRFLLRMPYGEDGDECESLAFEELGANPEPAEYLWGNPALAGAILLAQAFAQDRWQMRPASHRELDGLPLPLLHEDGEAAVRHPAESAIGPDAAEGLLERGIIPLAPVHDRNAVRIVRFQSVAEPLAPLAGRWAST